MTNIIEISKEDEEKYEEERKQIEEIFGDTKFTIAIPLDELDELLTDKKQVIIKSWYGCYCYDNAPRNNEYFTICGDNLTIKYILLELKRQNLHLDCNHHFIEGFDKTSNSNCQFIIGTGS